jgi:hypothetical protein
MTLSIVIVSYNSKNHLTQCLESIYTQEHNLNYEVIVVDNASTDASVSLVKERFPQVQLISNKVNLGFAKANNIGVEAVKGEYILFLNPDTVIQKNALKKMVNFMKENIDAGVVGPKLLNSDGSIQFSCRRFYNFRTILFRRTLLGKVFPNSQLLKYHLMADWNHNEVKEVDWVLAACLMTRRGILEKIGYFDEKYKMYFEDVDLCKRVKETGYKVYYYHDAVVVHHHQRESAQRFSIKTIWHIQSAIRFFNKYGWKF